MGIGSPRLKLKLHRLKPDGISGLRGLPVRLKLKLHRLKPDGISGNVVDSATLGSIEYATEHLHSKLLYVLGHESCGAVRAAVVGGPFSPSIESIIEKIKPAVAAARRDHPGAKDIHPFAVRENVSLQIKWS